MRLLACCNRDGLQNPCWLQLCHHLRLGLRPKIKSCSAHRLCLQTSQAAWPRDRAPGKSTQGLEGLLRPSEDPWSFPHLFSPPSLASPLLIVLITVLAPHSPSTLLTCQLPSSSFLLLQLHPAFSLQSFIHFLKKYLITPTPCQALCFLWELQDKQGGQSLIL